MMRENILIPNIIVLNLICRALNNLSKSQFLKKKLISNNCILKAYLQFRRIAINNKVYTQVSTGCKVKFVFSIFKNANF